MRFVTLTLAAALTSGAAAAHTEDFVFTYVGGDTTANGLLTAIRNADNSYTAIFGELFVTSGAASGAYTLASRPSGTSPYLSASGFFIVDNQINTAASQPISWYGLLFTGNDREINIWSNGASSPYTFYAHGATNHATHGEFEFTSIPSPGVVGLLTASGVTLTLGRRSRGRG